MVPTPWPSAMRGVDGAAQVDEERLVDLVEQVALDRHGDRLRGLAGGEASPASPARPCSRPAPRRVPSAVAALTVTVWPLAATGSR